MVDQPAVIPALVYDDLQAAMDFLEPAFGFGRTLRVSDARGQAVHAEMAMSAGRVTLGPGGWANWARSPGSAAGAHILAEPADQFHGHRTYRAHDPQGHVWTFAQALRDLSDEEMSGASGLTITTWR